MFICWPFFIPLLFSVVSLMLTCLITLCMLQSYVEGNIFFSFSGSPFLGYYGIGLYALRLKTIIVLMRNQFIQYCGTRSISLSLPDNQSALIGQL